jgi:hypothetical protein
MNEPSPANLAPRPQNERNVAFRVLGILAIAFGTLQASLLVVSFPPSPRFAPGIYFGIAMGILGIPVFLLMRWAAVIFVAVWVAVGLLLAYALIRAPSAYWAVTIVEVPVMIIMPLMLLRSAWSSLR